MSSEPTPGPHTTDPEPASTAGSDGPGGGVVPGDTPPASSSEPEAVNHDQPVGEARKGLPVAVLAVLGLITLAVLGFVVARIVALIA